MIPVVFANMGEAIGNFLIKVLAVSGAFLIGYVAALFLVWLLGRLAFNRSAPRQAKRVVSASVGALVAVIVGWLLFFGSGSGGGWGFGPGFGFGTGQGTGDGTTETSSAVPTRSEPAPERPEPRPPESSGKIAPPMRILMLGGQQVRQVGDDFAYYQNQADGTAHTFDGIARLIREQMKTEAPIQGIVIVIRDDSVARNHQAVRRLEEFAKDHRLSISHVLPK